jgi:hypothetical protein
MPSHSKKQHNFMEAIAHSPSFAKKAGVPQSVGKDYAAADKGKTFGKGGNMKKYAEGGETSAKEQLMERQQKIKEKYDQQNRVPIGGRHMMLDESKGVLLDIGGIRRKPLEKAYDRLQNMREEEMESNKQRLKNMEKDERMSEKDMKDNEAYRKKPEYHGYEDYTPSGRAAAETYFSDPARHSNRVKLKGGVPYSPEVAKKAQAVQREVMNEGRRETRGTVPAATLKKGGDVKESKAMVGKEVAFMKKKGAPAAMIKHEKAEMKGMKAGGKVRRYGAGGGPLGDESIMTDEEYAKQREQGAKNWESLKNFFSFGKNKEEVAPIDRSRDIDRTTSSEPNVTYRPRPPLGITKPNIQSPRTRREGEDTEVSDAVERNDAASMDRTAKGPQYTSSINTSGGEYSGDGFSSVKKPELRPSRNRPSMISRTRETTSVTAAPTRSKVPAKINSEKLLRDAEEEVLRKKPTAMTEQMRKAPTINDLYRGQKSMGEEIGDVLKSFRDSIRGGLQKGKERQESKGSTMYAKGGNVKRMAEGGFTREADGAAKKGKTQGKMVKMAGGGFVKSADGCAQRGKTRASQVKMSRGGKC